MSLYQCEECGCRENTALGCFIGSWKPTLFDWTGIENRKGKKLCSACGPTHYSDGTATKFGQWHNQFRQLFLPQGKFIKNQQGNLEHIETGDTDLQKYEVFYL